MHPLSSLSSREAIKFISELNQAIVCLVSLQENFPNTGLEMGQLPVSLVVTETGGFQETLDLLERKDGVRYFQSGNSHALAQTITQAIKAYPETPSAPQRDFLEQVNQRLLNQRLEYMSQAFLDAAPKEPQTPRITIGIVYLQPTEPLLKCLENIAAQTYDNFDVIILYLESNEPVNQIIAQAQTKFPNYKYLSTDPKMGLGATYNYLVDLATGAYFLQLSAESMALPNMLEKLVTASGEASADVVICPQATLGEDGEIEAIAFVDGNLLNLLEFNCDRDISALFSIKLLQEFPYFPERDLQALNWHIFAAAIATDKQIAYYPYPLYALTSRAESNINSANLPKERYYLRQYLYQIEPSKWHQRQLNMLLTGVEQLLQQKQLSPQLSPQSQAWMITAQHLQDELVKTQVSLENLQIWNQQLQAGKDWLESQWQAWMLRAQKADLQWERSRSLIQDMQASKFWKLRKAWIKLKQKLGKIKVDPLQPAAHTFTLGVQEFVARIAGQKVRFFQPAASPEPSVSIISSCYEDNQYLETTYRSIVNQTLQNFEWIVIDDGSTETKTKSMLSSLSQRTAKIRLLSHSTHRGIAASYNTAIAQAKSKYLCFIDFGSILDPTYLEKCVLFLETHAQVSIVNSYSIVFQAQEHWWQTYLNQPISIFSQNGMMSHPLYRKADFEQLGGFDESLQCLADWERALKAIAHHQIGWTIPEYLDCYRATHENAPMIAQSLDGQQTISAIHSRHQTVPNIPSTIALEPQTLNPNTLNCRLNVENQLDRPNLGKRLLLFCEALDDSDVARWNCDLVILLEQRGYDLTIVTTSTSNHSCQEFFYRATPDIFHLLNLCDRVHWLSCIRHFLNSRQIDSVLISGSEIAYAFLPSLRAEFPHVVLTDYIHTSSAIGQISSTHPLSQSLNCRMVTSHRQAREFTSSNSYTKTRVCSTQADVEVALVEAFKAHQTAVPIETNAESEKALMLLLADVQDPIAVQSSVTKPQAPAEPTARQLLKLLLKKLVNR